MSGEKEKQEFHLYRLVSPPDQSASPEIFVQKGLIHDLVRLCLEALPHKAFGLVGGADHSRPKSLYPCSTNLRNTQEWRAVFESFGEFYKDPDLGFVISPREVKAVLETMESRGECFAGVFHSHRYLCAQPTEIDIALSSDPRLPSFIVSVADPAIPELGVFRLSGGDYETLRIVEC